MKKILASVVLAMVSIVFASNSYAQEKHETHLLFFWGDGCPHCAEAKPFVKELEEKYPELKVHYFETWKNRQNAQLFQEVAKAYNAEARGVPAFFIGDSIPGFGYNEKMQPAFIEKVETCIKDGCVNPLDKVASKGFESDGSSYASKVSDDYKAVKDEDKKEGSFFDSAKSYVKKLFTKEKIVMYFFWGDGCPHCAQAKPFLEELKKQYPDLDVRAYETWKDQEGIKMFGKLATAYGVDPRGVPAFFIGDNSPIFGYADSMKGSITSKIQECFDNGCTNPAVKAGLE
ncbi:MAG: TlpA family protein disulfide reductase [Alphaproteobacteria bacterium]